MAWECLAGLDMPKVYVTTQAATTHWHDDGGTMTVARRLWHDDCGTATGISIPSNHQNLTIAPHLCR